MAQFAARCAAFLTFCLAACSGGVLDARGPVAAADRQMMLNALAIMVAIVLPTIAAALYFAWWYRAGNRHAHRHPRFVYSGAIELIVWSIPLLVILFLSGVIWLGSHELDPARPLASKEKALEVQVVSLDWKWLFIYPEQGVAAVNQLVVPTGVPLHFSLTSASVMNSFFVPQLGSMIATMNGMVTELHLQADHEGDYYGLSTQYSGAGFSDMNFTVHAVAPGAFAQWIQRTKAAGPALDRNGYERLAQERQGARPFTYRQIDAGLFRAVATNAIAPQRGPRSAP